MDPGADLAVAKNRTLPETNSGRPACSLVTVLSQ
jgi:hypothetical protein